MRECYDNAITQIEGAPSKISDFEDENLVLCNITKQTLCCLNGAKLQTLAYHHFFVRYLN